MRLFLSSDKFGNRLDLLVQLVGQGAKAAVISNALDLIPQQNRDTYARIVHDPIADLREHGLDASAFDLRDYFGKPDALAAKLATLDFVWVTGGNVFLLRRAMRQSGFDTAGLDLIKNGKLAYGGWSAGAVVACPNLKGIDLMDDPNEVAPGYDPAPIYDGLDLVPFHIVPHYDSGAADSPAADKAVTWMLLEGMPYRTMRDGEVIVVDRDDIRSYEPA